MVCVWCFMYHGTQERDGADGCGVEPVSYSARVGSMPSCHGCGEAKIPTSPITICGVDLLRPAGCYAPTHTCDFSHPSTPPTPRKPRWMQYDVTSVSCIHARTPHRRAAGDSLRCPSEPYPSAQPPNRNERRWAAGGFPAVFSTATLRRSSGKRRRAAGVPPRYPLCLLVFGREMCKP